jgi:hypothetical protein
MKGVSQREKPLGYGFVICVGEKHLKNPYFQECKIQKSFPGHQTWQCIVVVALHSIFRMRFSKYDE